MKTKMLIIIILFICCFQYAYNQDYISFPDTSYTWVSRLCLDVLDCEPYVDCFTYSYHQKGDTVINGKNYKKLFCGTDFMDSNYIGGIRESNKKIYYRGKLPKGFSLGECYDYYADTTEYLLYDFSLKEGDSLNYYYPFHIGEIDSVFYADHWRKRYEIIKDTFYSSNPNQYPEYWLEGIGSTKDILYPLRFLCGPEDGQRDTLGWKLICVGKPGCYSVSINNQADIQYDYFIYPNPVNDILYINLGQKLLNNKGIIKIYNTHGQVLKVINDIKSHLNVDMTDFSNGIYYIFYVSNKMFFSKKIMVQKTY